MLEDVAAAIRACSESERAKLARFFAAQAEEKMSDRPGASRILSWLGVVAAGREPNEIFLEDIPPDDRKYVRDLAATLEGVVRDEAALNNAETPHDLAAASPADNPLLTVWQQLQTEMRRSIGD